MNRVTALLVALLVAASAADTAWRACAAMTPAAAARHECCDPGATPAAIRAAADDCCGMSQPAQDRGRVEIKFAPAPAPATRTSTHAASYAGRLDGAVIRRAAASARHSVPLYLRCSSLLI